MLLNLSIRDIVIIRHLDLTFGEGLNVLTGETGAGKSILLDALGLVLGERGDVSLIREGCESASITAEFYIESNEPICAFLAEQGIACADTIMIRRILASNGRSRAFIEDQAVSLSVLKQLGAYLIEIHGQFDHLLDPKSHRAYLDAFAQSKVEKVTQAFIEWQSAKKEYDAVILKDQEIRNNEDYLRFQLKELETLSPEEQEEEDLLEKRHKISHSSKKKKILGQARDEITQTISFLHAAEKSLMRLEGIENTEELLATLQRGDIEIQDCLDSILKKESLCDTLGNLDDIDERLQALRDMARKYRIPVSQLPHFYQTIRQNLTDLDVSIERLENLNKEVEKTKKIYQSMAEALSLHRHTAAENLIKAVSLELPHLKLGQTHFHVAVESLDESQWTMYGMDKVYFQIAANKGQSLADLGKVASGGERSRLMLALKAVFAEQTPISTLIFDEIDMGVGGAVATAIGLRLARLATQLQVLVITHSPQVAALGHHHYFIEKMEDINGMATQVRLLSLTERQEEIARMLSGADVTDEARSQAKRLMTPL